MHEMICYNPSKYLINNLQDQNGQVPHKQAKTNELTKHSEFSSHHMVWYEVTCIHPQCTRLKNRSTNTEETRKSIKECIKHINPRKSTWKLIPPHFIKLQDLTRKDNKKENENNFTSLMTHMAAKFGAHLWFISRFRDDLEKNCHFQMRTKMNELKIQTPATNLQISIP